MCKSNQKVFSCCLTAVKDFIVNSGHTEAMFSNLNELMDNEPVLVIDEVSHQAIFDDFVYYLEERHKCTRLSENVKEEVFEKLAPENHISANEICGIICNDI